MANSILTEVSRNSADRPLHLGACAPTQGTDRGSAVRFGKIISDALGVWPERVAFRQGDISISRQALLDAAGDLADRIRQTGLARGEPVVIDMGHCIALPVAMLATLLAGGCAVPLDPGVSEARRRAIIADIDARLMLRRDAAAPEPTAVSIEIRSSMASAVDDPELAFVVYTSGSTGTPKGVEITHAAYAERLCLIAAVAGPDPDGTVDLAWTPSSFIGMLDEIFFSLLTGAPVVIATEAMRTDAIAFAEMAAREGITRFRITPSLLNAFLNAGIHHRLAGVRTIFCSGESLGAALQVKAHGLLPAALWNFYGATEAPGVAYHVYDRTESPLTSTVCQLQAFAEARVVRQDGTEAAAGQDGEIWIGGFTLARGYWRRPDLTAAKFVSHDGRPWYRTGDRGRRLGDGRLEILGRVDLNEVKIHGVRIDVAEVRAALRAIDGIDDAWISCVSPEPGRDPVLIGHYVTAAGAGLDPDSVRAALATTLPPLAVPRDIIAYPRLPLLSNGKLDAQALDRDARAHLAARETATAATAPRKEKPRDVTPMEIAVLNCFEQALGRKKCGVDSDFFAAGGTSLEAVTLAALLSAHFRTEVGLDEIWLYPTARALAAHLEKTREQCSARTFFHVEGLQGPSLLAVGFGVAHLAGLWPDRRLFVSPGLTGDPRISLRKRLDSYVSEYLDGLRQTQPTGPYQLIGFSFCGLLVYEIARRLHAAGERVSGIVLLEPVTPLGRAPGRPYGAVATKEIVRSIVARESDRSRLLLRLVARSVLGSWAASAERLPMAYGYLVEAAECLQSVPIPVDLVYSDGFPTAAMTRWRAVVGPHLRLHHVVASEHTALIRPECVRQWRHVVDAW